MWWQKQKISASLLQSSVLHDPSEIIIICFISYFLTVMLLNIFVETFLVFWVQKNSIHFLHYKCLDYEFLRKHNASIFNKSVYLS